MQRFLLFQAQLRYRKAGLILHPSGGAFCCRGCSGIFQLKSALRQLFRCVLGRDAVRSLPAGQSRHCLSAGLRFSADSALSENGAHRFSPGIAVSCRRLLIGHGDFRVSAGCLARACSGYDTYLEARLDDSAGKANHYPYTDLSLYRTALLACICRTCSARKSIRALRFFCGAASASDEPHWDPPCLQLASL